MAVPILVAAGAVAIVLVGGGTAAGTYKALDNTTKGLKENVVPLAVVGASTFLLLRYLQKRGAA